MVWARGELEELEARKPETREMSKSGKNARGLFPLKGGLRDSDPPVRF